MKTIAFTYKKSGGSISERVLLAQTEPNEYWTGIDVSELDPIQAESFIDQAMLLEQEFYDKLLALQLAFDLKHNYRKFIAKQMSNIDII